MRYTVIRLNKLMAKKEYQFGIVLGIFKVEDDAEEYIIKMRDKNPDENWQFAIGYEA